jgi:hypothetical protein
MTAWLARCMDAVVGFQAWSLGRARLWGVQKLTQDAR